MSKKRKAFTDDRSKTLWMWSDCPEPPPRSQDEVDADVMRAASSAADRLPPEIVDAVQAIVRRITRYPGPTKWDSFKDYDVPTQLSEEVKDENEFITNLITQAADEGFRLALERYAKQLSRVPELASWHRTRKDAGDKGRKTQTSVKEDKAQRAREMFANGADIADIAREIGRSEPTVYKYLQQGTHGKPSKASRSRRR